jgi:uncharacterized protein (DUF488 family)
VAKAKSKTKSGTKAKAKKKAGKLFTIGYEKATTDAVLKELKRAKVKLLVDTRAVAASRKPGFSKKQLAAALDENGIAYLHLQKLGTPDDGRQAARAAKLETLWRIYATHLLTPEAIEAMDELVAIVKSGQPVCLLCFERDCACCHRSRIAEVVQDRTGIEVENLVPALF